MTDNQQVATSDPQELQAANSKINSLQKQLRSAQDELNLSKDEFMEAQSGWEQREDDRNWKM